MLATVVGQPAVARVLSLLYIVLPAYNEERGIALLLRRIDATLQPQSIAYRALVVDDGSRDNTAALVEDLATALPVELLRHGHNRGVGRALATGLTQAARLASPEDAIVTMEGDNGSDPGYIRLLIEQLDQGADIAIASPFAPGARFDVPPKRWLLSVGANTLLRLLVRLPGVRCYTGMYRAFRADLLQRAGQRQGDQIVTMDGFTGIAELMINLAPLRPRVREIPIYHRLEAGRQSKIRILPTIRAYLRLMARALRPRPLPPLPTGRGLG